jgi:hypothetical protein
LRSAQARRRPTPDLGHLHDRAAAKLAAICDSDEDLARLTTHVRDFAKMMTGRHGDCLDTWITTAEHDTLPPLASFARNLRRAMLDDQTASNISLASQQVKNNVLTPKVPTGNPVQTYFVELVLKHNGNFVDRNVYWLATQPDMVNWSKTLGQPQGTISTYANLTGLSTLPQSTVSVTVRTLSQSGPDGADRATTVTITNTSSSTVAFLLRADVRRGTAKRAGVVGRQRAAVIDLAEQRHHAVPRRVADTHRYLQLSRPAGGDPGDQRVRLERSQDRRSRPVATHAEYLGLQPPARAVHQLTTKLPRTARAWPVTAAGTPARAGL